MKAKAGAVWRRLMDEQLKKLRVSEIKAGRRHRKDFGDLKSLAQSIKEEGLLQPVGVTADMKLVFGERRLRAVRDVLKRKTIIARIVDVSSIVAGEWTENEIRKDFSPSERVSIAKAIEKAMPERRGKGKGQNVDGLKGRSDEIAAKRAGFGNRQTYRHAQKVLENGSPKLILAMDQGRVSISAAALFADTDIEEQDAVLQLDEKAILQAAREIRQRDTETRKSKNNSPAKPKLSKAKRIKATKLIHGDCLKEMPKLRANSVDAIISDPIYAEVSREYGRISEAKWHDLMQAVVIESRRVLKPTGSAVFIFQPNYEKIGKMRIWLWEFLVWAAKEWNLIQDCYWWATDAMPLAGSHRKQGLMRQSVKMCIWLGPPDCYRNQDGVLCTPSDAIFANHRSEMALKKTPSGRTYRHGRIADTANERAGTTPFNLLPIPAGGNAERNGHPAPTPYDLAAWWCRYILPPKGVLLDPFCGSATVLSAGLDNEASKVIGIEKMKKYVTVARKRIEQS